MQKNNKQFILDYIDDMCSNPKTTEQLDKYIAETDIELKNHIIAFEKGMPNYQGEIHDIIAEGDKVVVRVTFTGIHKGELFGQPPTNNPVRTEAIVIYQIKNGKIIDHWMQSDSFALMQQIGAIRPASYVEEEKILKANNYSVLITDQGQKGTGDKVKN